MNGMARMKAPDPARALVLINMAREVYAKPALLHHAATTEKATATPVVRGRGADCDKNQRDGTQPNKPLYSPARESHIRLLLH
jgi:hypothetical protein